MLHRSVRGALRLALGILAGAPLTATPAKAEVRAEAQACEPMPVEAAALIPGLARHELAGDLVPPFVALWQAYRPEPLPELPDRVAVFATPGRPLIVAYGRQGCLPGVLPVARDEVWALLRRAIGPVA